MNIGNSIKVLNMNPATMLGKSIIFNQIQQHALPDIANYVVNNIIKQNPKLKNYGSSRTYNESDLPETQLNAIDYLVRKRAKELNINPNSFKNNNDTIKTVLNASSLYPKIKKSNYGNVKDPMSYRVLNPIGQIEHTLGDFTIEYTPQGYRVSDIYDFNSNQGKYPNRKNSEGNGYVGIRRKASRYAHTDNTPDVYKMRYDINRKVNHW